MVSVSYNINSNFEANINPINYFKIVGDYITV